MSRNVRKRAFSYVRPVKIQISLRICAESPLGPFWIAKDAKFLHAGNVDCAHAQAELSTSWAHMSEDTFSRVAAKIILQR